MNKSLWINGFNILSVKIGHKFLELVDGSLRVSLNWLVIEVPNFQNAFSFHMEMDWKVVFSFLFLFYVKDELVLFFRSQLWAEDVL